MTVDDVTRDTWQMVRELLPEDKCREAVSNPVRNINIVAVRCKGLAGMESRLPLGASMLLTAGANAISRKSLGLFYDRVILHSHEKAVEGLEGYGRQDIRLTANNVHAAVLASGSIPFVMHGIRDFEGSSQGVYRDGGFTDYHFDEPWRAGDGIVLYPHFYDYLVPGWFDKGMKKRRAGGSSVDDVLLVSPSREFVQTYLGGQIPDRRNFTSMDNADRLAFWRRTLDEGNRMADELTDLLADHDKLVDRLEPFDQT